jgi:hypothetical protein
MADKRLERWYVAQLRTAVSDFPLGEVVPGESPDFIVRSDKRTVGIEVTAFHLPPAAGERPHQEQQSLKDRVVDQARRLHTDAGGPGLYVSVYFGDPVLITKRGAREFADAVASIVLETSVPASFDEPVMTVPWHRLPPGIVGISIRASIDGRDRLWSAHAGGWVAPVQPQHIEAVIQRKHGMLSVAKSKCSEVWLVIVNDDFSKAAPVELTEAAARHSYEHAFDRLLWLQPHAPQVYDLASMPANSSYADKRR